MFLCAAAVAASLTPFVARLGMRLGAVDRPDERKVHRTVVPRLGGVSVGVAVAIASSVGFVLAGSWPDRPDPLQVLPLGAAALLVFGIGLWDDLRSVSPQAKLAGQVLAAALVSVAGVAIEQVVVFGTPHDLGALAVPATVLWVVGLTNAINLMDGLDGLAAGLVAIAASSGLVVLASSGEWQGAVLLAGLAGAMTGFLPYNFHPASVFLGDAGSLLAGFLLAVATVAGPAHDGATAVTGVPVLVFALPLAETALTVVRRLIEGQRHAGPRVANRIRALRSLLVADRQHIHHRLLAGGWSHQRVVLVLYAVSLAFAALAPATPSLFALR